MEMRRSPRGGRGLKLSGASFFAAMRGRSPRGGRGLKLSHKLAHGNNPVLSLPSRGAWIETDTISNFLSCSSSLPSRGAWIETINESLKADKEIVAPLAGGVD